MQSNPPRITQAPVINDLEPGLTLDRLVFGYKDAPVLTNVMLDLPMGSASVVTGPNGSGKSTLLYLAAGLLRPLEGTVLMGGQRIDNLLPSERFQRGLRVGFVFQEGGLLMNMNALANVALPLRYHADALGLTLEGVERRAKEALERAHLAPSDYYRLPAHLSFGNRKRLALARSLALYPNYFFFDDPDVGLDPRTAGVIHELLCELRDAQDVTLLVGTNRAQLIERLEVPGYRLQDGALSRREDLPESVPPSIRPLSMFPPIQRPPR